jgi:hypothetical protein
MISSCRLKASGAGGTPYRLRRTPEKENKGDNADAFSFLFHVFSVLSF